MAKPSVLIGLLPFLDDLAMKARYKPGVLAVLCRMTPRSMQREFQQHFGISAEKWLADRRMKKADEYVRRGMRTKEIAYKLGYKNVRYFCRQFKNMYHETVSSRKKSSAKPVR